ncbi:MAG: flagellar biosynthesis protein FlhB [Thermacetogeniaceae bacterium]
MASEDRTEQPTQKRREETRKKGMVARSVELNSALILLATFYCLKLLGLWIGGRSLEFTTQIMEMIGQQWGSSTFNQLLILSAAAFAEIAVPIMLVAMTAGCVANLVQVGFMFIPELIMPKLERINPLEGLKRIISRRALVELLKAVIKIGVAGYIAFGVVNSSAYIFPRLMDMGLPDTIAILGNLGSTIVFRVGLFFLVLAVADYAFQYTEHMKMMRMTKQEVKEELRQFEGDPQIKGRIRQRQRQFAMQRMMQQVPKADVVITNPTHYAVALKYEARRNRAPVVLAKGVDELAQRIRDTAREHDVIIYEDPLLAQTLYKTVEIGQAIPESLYEAVANVLAFVYRLRPGYFKNKGRR